MVFVQVRQADTWGLEVCSMQCLARILCDGIVREGSDQRRMKRSTRRDFVKWIILWPIHLRVNNGILQSNEWPDETRWHDERG